MRPQTQTIALALIICTTALSMQFISCKKDNSPKEPIPVKNEDSTVTAKENLVAWYKFTDGNTADFSGKNNHLIAYNVTPATDSKGRTNNAFAFNGFSSYMQAPNSMSLNPSKTSLVALVKPTGFYSGAGSTSRILMKGTDDQSNGVYFLGFFNNGSAYGGYGDNQYQSSGLVSANDLVQLNNWYTLIYTYDGSISTLYINGTLINQTNTVAAFTPNNDFLRIGTTGRSDFPYWFNGIIDEIRIYNSSLSAEQVTLVNNEIGK